jgi:glycosyltransferase involved in cell wall biosynthesis
LDRMVRSYALCRKKGASLPKLVLAGPDFRGGRDYLAKLIAELGLEKVVELPGPVKGQEKESLLNRASLFLHTSRWEGLPLSILEAMAHGAPCLVTQGTNFADVIRTSGTGYCAGESDEEIAAAMASVNLKETPAMGIRARQLVEKEYSWERVADRLLQAYQRWCGATFPVLKIA